MLNVDVSKIREKEHLLDGIAPEVVEMLKNRMVGSLVFSTLRKMKPMRQIEAVEMMLGANRLTTSYAKMVLVTTRPELLVEPKKVKISNEIALEDIARMEREMEKLHQDYQAVEDSVGETMLALVVAKGYVAKLLRNSAINDYLKVHHADLVEGITAVMEAITTDARTLERE